MLVKLNKQREYFNSQVTHDYTFRKLQLNKLQAAIKLFESELIHALKTDLNKPEIEAYASEIAIVYSAIKHASSELQQWMRPHKESSSLALFYSRSYTLAVPLGVVLIVAPWNYPAQLLLAPLVGAIAAGNCAVLKPSEYTPNVAGILQKIIKHAFSDEYISCMIGDGATVVPQLIKEFDFNYVFFTGSSNVGKSIATLCAQKLIPYTLELGGKSPAIVDVEANIEITCKRIAWAKFYNSGQTCVAPDYVLVDARIKNKFITTLIKVLDKFYPDWQQLSKIVNQQRFATLVGYLHDSNIIYGGRFEPDKLMIQPTLINEPSFEHPLMSNEIFGPILPILAYTNTAQLKEIIGKNPYPLALYVFSENKEFNQDIIKSIQFGGGCINTALMHLVNENLPFGGVMASGQGQYHGKYSFTTFSHIKAIVDMPTWLDVFLKYPPYTKFKQKLLRKFIG